MSTISENILKENEAIIEYLRHSRLFNHLSEEHLKQLMPLSEMCQFPKGSRILAEGQDNSKVFFLLQGIVGVYSHGERIILLKRRGDIIGEMSVISNKPCAATVIAETNVEMFTIRARDIGSFTDLDNDAIQHTLYRVFAMIMTEKLSMTTEKARHFEENNRELHETQVHLQHAYSVLDDQVKQLTHAKIEAEEANRSKSSFLASVSHEIRTPMNSILGFTDILDGLIIDSSQREYLKAIKTSGKTLLGLINDILDLSKIEAGKIQLEYSNVGPHAVFHEMELIFSNKLEKKGLDFQLEIAEGLPSSLSLDETRFRQILMNLVSNAIKFTETGYVKISVSYHYLDEEQKQLNLIVEVEDTGIGIPDNQQGLIFNAFEQREGQRQSQYGGTGLGLAITKRLVETMGGEIAVFSQEGKGSKFRIQLNEVHILHTDVGEEQEMSIDPSNVHFETASILIVDDVRLNRFLLKGYLPYAELHLQEASNGKEALDMARNQHFDIILMDLKMPVMDGYEATERFKNDDKLKKIPIILLTAVAVDREEHKVLELSDGILNKPVNQTVLLRELMRFLPHTIHEVTSEEPSEFYENIEFDKKPLPALLKDLEKNVVKTWERRDELSINELGALASEISELADKHQYPPLKQLGNEMQKLTQLFDIDALENKMNTFPEIFQKIKDSLA